MNEPGTYYEGLMAKYFSGEATPEEVMQLSAWLTGNPDNINVFEAYRQVWMLTTRDAISAGIDTDAEWKTIATRMVPEGPAITPALSPAGRGRLIKFMSSWKVAAAAVLLVAAASAILYLNSGPRMVELTAENNNLEKVLPDGSVVTLNRGTVITYPETFGKETREVELEGEAYFNVTRDAKRPFIVSGGEARIKVLGTSFNVNTGKGNHNISVVLTSGSVALYFEGMETESRQLIPGERAEMKTGQKSIVTVSNPDPNYMAWKTGILVFENAELRAVAATLGKVYHTEIRLPDKQLSDCSLTATFEKQPLSHVLHVIGETLGLSIRQENGTYIFEGSGCN